jgi:hypothetical protein
LVDLLDLDRYDRKILRVSYFWEATNNFLSSFLSPSPSIDFAMPEATFGLSAEKNSSQVTVWHIYNPPGHQITP